MFKQDKLFVTIFKLKFTSSTFGRGKWGRNLRYPQPGKDYSTSTYSYLVDLGLNVDNLSEKSLLDLGNFLKNYSKNPNKCFTKEEI